MTHQHIEIQPSMTAERLQEKRQEATDYLIERGKHIYQKNFKATPSAKTNIIKTMKLYVQDTMPAMRRHYAFLF